MQDLCHNSYGGQVVSIPRSNAKSARRTITPVAAVLPAVPSLPPVPAEETRLASTPPPRTKHAKAKQSMVRKQALAIVAFRAAGYSTKQIADELHVLPGSIKTIMWRASKQGFLKNPKTGESLLDDPIDVVEYELGTLAVDNYRKLLTDDTILERGQKSTRMEATLEFAKNVLFKKVEGVRETPAQTMNALKIEIVMPTTGMSEARPNAMGGKPQSFLDAKIEEGN